jgi:hypothetical protein
VGVRPGSGMGQMGEDQRATPAAAEPVKKSPSAWSAPYDVAPPLPRESVAGKPWKEAGRSHTAAARAEATSSTVARVLRMHRGSQARRLRERAKAAHGPGLGSVDRAGIVQRDVIRGPRGAVFRNVAESRRGCLH